jgi:hypothetical protein
MKKDEMMMYCVLKGQQDNWKMYCKMTTFKTKQVIYQVYIVNASNITSVTEAISTPKQMGVPQVRHCRD